MTAQQMAVIAIAAVLIFWMVGAYNRLMALRNGIGAAFALVDDGLMRRAEAVAPLTAALREPLHSEQGALDMLLAAQQQLRNAADALRARPMMASLVAAVVACESDVAAASSRVLALLEQHPQLLADAAVAPHVATLRDADARLHFARQTFNEAAQRYNLAARQFPTRWLARLYGFGKAGRL